MSAVAKQATMTSREIAKLCEKRHPDVKRDIENMLGELGLNVSSFAHIYRDTRNREQTEYSLDRELTETLITGYSIPLRHKVVKRLRELETVVQRGLPPAANDSAVEFGKLALAHLPNLGDNSKQALLSHLSELAFGQRLIPLPLVEQHLMPAGEVGELLGITPNKVGRLANAHGLKTTEFGEYRLDKSRHSSKQVESFFYNQAGLARLREIVEASVPVS
ncbi:MULTISPECIES: Rha family transcriptional regulator [unclassified Pseudomonas]|uniref:Rha family transcriptional regulator n=1 Tax=unclassified Pseudomonas TaxID=196821 RepID=UPI002362E056|nr:MULTISPECIES: Rha family transcriptional regulator [unclassified Pseudomonas]